MAAGHDGQRGIRDLEPFKIPERLRDVRARAGPRSFVAKRLPISSRAQGTDPVETRPRKAPVTNRAVPPNPPGKKSGLPNRRAKALPPEQQYDERFLQNCREISWNPRGKTE